MKWLTVPNVLSISRVPLALTFLFVGNLYARIVIVTVVALTDLADGFLARRMRSHDRRSGQLIDPVTDKMFVAITLTALMLRGELTLVQYLVVLSRDIYNSIAYVLLTRLGWKISFRARLSGKVATVLQMAVLLAALFWKAVVPGLVLVLAAVSVFAILDYTRAGLRQHHRES